MTLDGPTATGLSEPRTSGHAALGPMDALTPPDMAIANMFLIPAAIAVRAVAPASFWTSIGSTSAAFSNVDPGGFVSNLVPVTLGNIVGGALLVAAMYWLAYLRHEPRPGQPDHGSPQRRIERV